MSKLTPSRWVEAIKSSSPREASPGPVRVVVVGCGELAQTAHLPLLRRSGDFVIVGIADSDPAQLAACSTIAKRAAQTSDYRELLTSWVADAVVLSLPTSLHASAAEAAFDAGLHVYLEKPIASDFASARSVMHAWQASGRVGMIGHNYRFNPLYVKLKQMIAGGRIGNPRDARMVFTTPASMEPTWRDKRRDGGGVLLDLATHHIDMVRFLFSSEVAYVTATIESRRSEHDHADILLELTNDVFAKLTLGFTGGFADRIQIIGEAGSLFVDRAASLDVEFKPAANTPMSSGEFASMLPSPRAQAAHLYAKLRAPYNEPSFGFALKAFGSAIVNGKAASPDIGDGYTALSVIAAAEYSSAQGRRVAVSEALQGQPQADLAVTARRCREAWK